MSDDDLFGTRPRGAPAMGRRGGGERSTERASPALAADFADDASDEETARPPARRSGGWADEDAAELRWPAFRSQKPTIAVLGYKK